MTAYDPWGQSISGTSPQPFRIVDEITPVLVPSFELRLSVEGVLVEWSLAPSVAIETVAVERGASPVGPFVAVEATAIGMEGIYRLIDSDVHDGTWWYRLVRRANALTEVMAGPNKIVLSAIRRQNTLSLRGHNPVRDLLSVRVEIGAAGEVSLCLVDISGRRVRDLLSGELPSGPRDVEIDASTLPPGIYFVRLRQGGESTSLRIAVVH